MLHPAVCTQNTFLFLWVFLFQVTDSSKTKPNYKLCSVNRARSVTVNKTTVSTSLKRSFAKKGEGNEFVKRYISESSIWWLLLRCFAFYLLQKIWTKLRNKVIYVMRVESVNVFATTVRSQVLSTRKPCHLFISKIIIFLLIYAS